MSLAVWVDVSEVDAAEQAVSAFARESDPPAVGRPAVPRIASTAVDLQGPVSLGLEVHDVQVAASMEDGEATVLGRAKQEEVAVG